MVAPQEAHEPVACLTLWPSLTCTAGEPKRVEWLTWWAHLSQCGPFLGASHGGWSAATFEPCARAKANVKSLCAAVLDYDEGVTIAEACQTWGGVFGFLHTTKSHQPGSPSFRVILPFSREVTPKEYALLWEALYNRTRRKTDRSTKDPSRFWFLPGSAHPELFESIDLEGDLLDVDALLASVKLEAPPPALPSPVGMLPADRARRYLDAMPPAVAGQHGHDACLKAAEAMVNGFDLGPEAGLALLKERYNARCKPAWSDAELAHKCEEPAGGWQLERGRLLRGRDPEPRREVRERPSGQRDARVEINDEPDEPPARGLARLSRVALTGRDACLEAASRPIEYAWQDIAVVGTIVVIAGGVAEGKTLLLFLVLVARLHGSPIQLLGRHVLPAPQGQVVVLIEAEQDSESTARRLKRSFDLLGVDDHGFDRLVIIARKSVRIGSQEWGAIVEMCEDGLVSDIALDTIARVAPSEANDEGAQVEIFDRVACAIEAAPEGKRPTVWVCAHKRKGEGHGLEMVSGSAQRTGQADSVCIVEGERDANGQTVASLVTFEKLRHDPERYPEATRFAVLKAPDGERTLKQGASTASDGRPLEERILEALEAGPLTKRSLRDRLRVGDAILEDALSALFAVRHVRSTVAHVGGREWKAIERSSRYDDAERSTV